MMIQQVFAQTALLAGQLETGQTELLMLLCQAAVTSLKARLKKGVTVEDCREDFLMAASLYALAAMRETDTAPEEFKAGDLTIRKGSGTRADRLRRHAEQIIRPWVMDDIAFLGV